jgi:DNA-binding response OmpR family regulator/anti-sigma regulatory factor (Ser/Thr protein kinase)
MTPARQTARVSEGTGEEVAGQGAALARLAGGVAHEFNNLLTGMMGYAQMALEDPDNPELSARAHRICLDAARRGSEIVERLARFAGTDEAELEAIDPVCVVGDVVDLVRSQAETHGIDLSVTCSPVPLFHTEGRLLSIAILEVIENALQAVENADPEQRKVRIRVDQEGAGLRILVEDQGSGMTAEEIQNAGQPFYTTRGPIALGNDVDAKGLGLAEVRGIVRRLGGEVAVESTPGEGTTVTLTFVGSDVFESPVRKPRILVVDDDPSIRRLFDGILRRAGFEVSAVGDGAPAMEALGERRYDLVLLDQMMPKMSGLEVLAGLRDGLAGSSPPVVMVTAAHSRELAREALAAGASACVSKPINHQKIVYLARTYCRGALARSDEGMNLGRGRPIQQPQQQTILVHSSDVVLREVTDLILRRSGYRTELAEDAAAAVRLTECEYFDLILLDTGGEDAPAAGLVRELRMNNPYSPILVSLAQPGPENGRRLLQAGASRAIRKPLDIQRMLGEISELIETFGEPARRAGVRHSPGR